MNRRTLLLSSVALLPLVQEARSQEEASLDDLQAVASSQTQVDRMLINYDTVRWLLALSVSESSEEAVTEFAASSTRSRETMQRVREEGLLIARRIVEEGNLQLSQESIRLVAGVETTLSENGINRDSRLGRELFTSFRSFVKIIEVSFATSGITDWFCRDYPFRRVCELF